MPDPLRTPLLVQLLSAAGVGDAPQRLLLWAAAFDDWLADRRKASPSNNARRSLNAWRSFLTRCPRPPWEITPSDIASYTGSMASKDYSSSTIAAAIGDLVSFYRWCSDRRIDPECAPGFNPAAEQPRPKLIRADRISLLSQEEVDRFLDLLRQDPSPLARRDYAFFLARLRLGVPNTALRCLRWEQLKLEMGAAWVCWSPAVQLGSPPSEEPKRLPDDVWDAIRAYLHVSGRWSGMADAHYIFPPLSRRFWRSPGSEAADWQPDCCLTSARWLQILKLYGQLAGIPKEKLNLRSLRSTSLRLHVEQAAGPQDMHAFMANRSDEKQTRYRLKFLPQLPPDAGRTAPLPPPPVRGVAPLAHLNQVIHGYYAQSQPPEAVAAVLKEDISGMEAEFVGLRVLGRGLLTFMERSDDRRTAAQVANAYTLIAARLASMVRAEEQLAGKADQSSWALNIIATFSRRDIEDDTPLSPSEVDIGALLGEPDLTVESRRLLEEIASMRYVLRNLFDLAMDSADIREYIGAVEKYGQGCIRLLRLLHVDGGDGTRLEAYVKEKMHEAHLAVLKELGMVPENTPSHPSEPTW